MPEFGSLYVSYSGLDAQRKRLDVIGDNIANVDTEGYHRQRVLLKPVGRIQGGLHTGHTKSSGGVSADEINRMRDETLAAHARNQSSVAADRTASAKTLNDLEGILAGLDDGGLRSRMTEFFNTFDDLANVPEDPAVRAVVLQQAESVADGFTQVSADINDLHRQSTDTMLDQVRQINMLSEQIATMNDQIRSATTNESQPNALLDRRDLKVAELAQLVDITVVETGSGQIVVSLDGHHLVSGDSAMAVAAELQTDPSLAAVGYQKYGIANENGRELRIGGGELAASLRAISQLVPSARIELDTLRDDLMAEVNTLHAGGMGLDGSTGNDMFEAPADPTSGGLLVSADVAGQPEKVAAAAVGAGTLDTGNAEAMAELSESIDGPVTGYITMVTDLAASVNTAEGAAGASQAASTLAQNLALAVGGVSLDQELTDLITAQRAYEASARTMTAIDEMLQTLINQTGLVGR
ncbi:MAG: flagellar hook-associated protein FlgK [Actinomycetota bacterium]